MRSQRFAFTLVEIVMVIVVIGILSAIALPKLASAGTNAKIAKGKSDISAIRSAIITERQSRIMIGKKDWIDKLTPDSSTTLFTGNGSTTDKRTLLTYGIEQEDKDGWKKTAAGKYTYTIDGKATEFIYDNTTGRFTCTVAATNYCADLIK